MHHLHVNPFTVLSLAIAILGAWTALDLFNRTRDQIGATRLRWLSVAALALGVSIDFAQLERRRGTGLNSKLRSA